MPILIIGVGKLKESWAREGCAEYVKRLGRYCQLDIKEIPDQPEPQTLSAAGIDQVKAREGEGILTQIRPGDRVVALCIDGKSYSSTQLAQKLQSWSMDGKRLVLVIGGSLGLGNNVISRADEKLSFSQMTFPHQLMRLILLEQLYRGFKINANERYHK
ncbi:MAG: 23S rRNA (pseudouridine(1915)-N(3))-methyltransferase RlmH [Clostridia bacterium]|nr:23S rRNA (pseudouridine(1915)-N(3))-methyltransferase RlmH [Clostridia bacterium]